MWLTFRSGPEDGRAVEAVGERFVIGREEDCDLVVRDDKVSRHHAALRALPAGRTELRDLGSSNGTLVDGRAIDGPVVLSGGERLRLGDTELAVSLTEEEARLTTVGTVPLAAAAPGEGPTPSAIERLRLRRSLRLTWLVGGIVVLAGIAVGLLFATGVLGGGGATSEGDSAAAVVALTKPSTVLIQVGRGSSDPVGSGTGWVLDAGRGLIVTNAHVTGAGNTWRVRTPAGVQAATLVASSPCDDLALLHVRDVTGLRTLPLGSQSDLQEGQTIVALGFPGTIAADQPLQVTRGVVSVAKGRIDVAAAADLQVYPDVVQIDAPINPGNSGGPLVTLDGRLVGVTTLGNSRLQNQNFAIGVDRVKEVLRTFRSGHSLGFTGANLDIEGELGVDPADGIGVIDTVPGSPAAAKGVPAPAVIRRVNGAPIVGLRGYCQTAGALQAPAAADFTIADAQGNQDTVSLEMVATPLTGAVR